MKYVNPFTDYGFKRLFGEKFNKELLKDFISEVLKEETGKIEDIQYLNPQKVGPTELDRGAVFDIYCKNEKGEYFIVELQKAKQNYFKDRSVYYATFPIQEQAKRGEWDYELKGVYTIGILDFVFEENRERDEVMSKVKLCDLKTKEVFYDKLTFVYLEMPKFKKREAELESHLDKWMYVFRNLGELQARPKRLQERIFKRLFESAEISKFNREELQAYEESLKKYRDIQSVINTAVNSAREKGREEGLERGEAIGLEKGREEGREEGLEKGEAIGLEKGREEGEQAIIQQMKASGLSDDDISQILKTPS